MRVPHVGAGFQEEAARQIDGSNMHGRPRVRLSVTVEVEYLSHMMLRSQSSLPTALMLLTSLVAFGCDDSAGGAGSASSSAKASAPTSAAPKPSAPASTPAPPRPEDEPAGEAKLPGTPLKDVLKDVATVMGVSKTTSAMGVMTSEKKDVAGILDAVGLDQKLDKPFGAKCVQTTRLAFQSKDSKQLGMISFCDGDADLKTGSFDGAGAERAAVTIKDPAKLIAAMKKLGAMK